MASEKLKYVSAGVLDELLDGVADNLARYTEGKFDDLAAQNGWSIEAASVDLDVDELALLKKGATTPQAEIENSLHVHAALRGMTPSLAREERIWVRLTHVECLDYSRSRWLAGKPADAIEKLVSEHFFAGTLTSMRDDNAIARLWWNAHIAAIGCPEDPEKALALILKRADIRSNFVERTRTVSRPVLARGLIRVMESDPWVTSTEDSFREFMKVMNRDGGGILFEVLGDQRVDDFMRRCSERAQRQLANGLAQAA
jgi:hypothetical protein